jgi:hypothetical protein
LLRRVIAGKEDEGNIAGKSCEEVWEDVANGKINVK